MKCPYCNHILTLRETKQGLYGKCAFCRFSGYIPKEIPSDKVTERIEEGSNEEEELLEMLPCCAKYKTKWGLRNHLIRVNAEKEEHPRTYNKHKRAYGEDLDKFV